ncbi:MAG: hypothetical protein ABR520_01665 [Mycobacteriales bacterium]|nr:hypothetical protein [Frankia sp.]
MTRLLILATTAVVVVAAELTMRAVGGIAEEPLWWHDLFTQRKEMQMRRLGRRGGVDIVVIGSSKMLFGVDPTVIAERTGFTCFNASIYRGVPTVTEAWLADRVLPLLRPKVVVVGMSPTEVNDNSPLIGRLDEYRAARVFHLRRGQRVVRAVGLHVFLVRYAGLLVHPRKLLRLIRQASRRPEVWRWRVPAEIPGVLGSGGDALDFLSRSYFNGPRMRELIRQQAGVNYDNGGVQSGAYRRMVALCAAYGARLLFAAMPASQEFLDDLIEGGRRTWQREWERLRALAQEAGTAVVDPAGEFEDHRYFADMVHMNGVGRAAYSAALADALMPQLSSLGLKRDVSVRRDVRQAG